MTALRLTLAMPPLVYHRHRGRGRRRDPFLAREKAVGNVLVALSISDDISVLCIWTRNCSFCDKRFTRRDKMVQHEKSHKRPEDPGNIRRTLPNAVNRVERNSSTILTSPPALLLEPNHTSFPSSSPQTQTPSAPVPPLISHSPYPTSTHITENSRHATDRHHEDDNSNAVFLPCFYGDAHNHCTRSRQRAHEPRFFHMPLPIGDLTYNWASMRT
ncbi:hypothetical protein K474DRAFT_830342 [Panus rudis PR-1116 ss-1]|nr:hypothetical protein K474DRAFT_830342 [Panus rudis PR-1116 ss-1]